jgi:hypothetical protein
VRDAERSSFLEIGSIDVERCMPKRISGISGLLGMKIVGFTMLNVGRGSILSAEARGSWLKTLRVFASSLCARGKDQPFIIISYTKRAHTPKGHSERHRSELRESFFSLEEL